MGWHKFLMKHGIGSPGYIAGKLADAYRFRKMHSPLVDYRTIIRSIFVERIAAQSVFGGPPQYRLLRRNSWAIEELVNHHPDLFSIVMLSIFIEHPELVGPGSRSDTFEVLDETVQETLDDKVPGWRTGGVWSKPDLTCYLCRERINHPDAGTMYVAINEEGDPEYHCAQCAIPIQLRAMSDLGYFMDNRFH